MTITYIASVANGANVNPGTLTINVPAGTQNGDVEYAWITSNTDTIPTPPSGWNQVTNAHLSGAENMTLWTHVAASEPASWSWTNCSFPEGVIRTYRGVNNTTPTIASGVCFNFTVTSCAVPSLTATIPAGAVYAGAWTADAGAITKPAGFGNDKTDATQRQLYAGDIALSSGSSAPSATATVSPGENFEGIGVVLNPDILQSQACL